MTKCNGSTAYIKNLNNYQVCVGLTGKGFEPLDFVWDTGASYSTLYYNYLSDNCCVDQIKLQNLRDNLDQEASIMKWSSHYKSKYIHKHFISASGNKLDGVLCCLRKVLVDTLLLENFYFYLIFSESSNGINLLGTDFISCCKRSCDVAGNEIFTVFDEELYEKNNKEISDCYNGKPFNLNSLIEEPPDDAPPGSSGTGGSILKSMDFFR